MAACREGMDFTVHGCSSRLGGVARTSVVSCERPVVEASTALPSVSDWRSADVPGGMARSDTRTAAVLASGMRKPWLRK